MSAYQKSIGKEAAIAMAESGWWIGREDKEVAKIGMFTKELCLPFSELHRALESALGIPVWTHELGLSFDSICQELLGEKDPPTIEDIMNLIPEDKRVLVTLG